MSICYAECAAGPAGAGADAGFCEQTGGRFGGGLTDFPKKSGTDTPTYCSVL